MAKNIVTTEKATPKDELLSSFSQRLWALFLDGVILILFGITLSLFLSDQFIRLGSWGVMVGFMITLCYLGIGNSYLTKGQTLGKKLNNIKVNDYDGNLLSLGRSLARSAILITPYFLTGINLPPRFLNTLPDFIKFLASFGVGASIMFFYLFNKATRQTVHDFPCRSLVCQAGFKGPVKLKPISPRVIKFFYTGAIIFAIMAAIGILTPNPEATKINNLQGHLLKIKGSWMVNAILGTNPDSSKKNRYVTVQVYLKEKNLDLAKVINEAAQITFANYPLADKEWLEVIVCYGYNIGLTQNYQTRSEKLPPTKWRKKLGLKQ